MKRAVTAKIMQMYTENTIVSECFVPAGMIFRAENAVKQGSTGAVMPEIICIVLLL